MIKKKKPELFEWRWGDKAELTLIQFLEKAEGYLEQANQNILDSEGDPCFSDWRLNHQILSKKKLQKGMYALGRLICQLKGRERNE